MLLFLLVLIGIWCWREVGWFVLKLRLWNGFLELVVVILKGMGRRGGDGVLGWISVRFLGKCLWLKF